MAPLVAEAVHPRLPATPKVLAERGAAFGSVSSWNSFVPNTPLVPTVDWRSFRFAQKSCSGARSVNLFLRKGAARRILLASCRGTAAPR